ncbi:MAG: hypothetical protein U0470_05280 [Anaerolineae bacterium]
MTIGASTATPFSPADGAGRRVLRRIRKGVAAALALLAVLLLAGAGYESLAGGVDALPVSGARQSGRRGRVSPHILASATGARRWCSMPG